MQLKLEGNRTREIRKFPYRYNWFLLHSNWISKIDDSNLHFSFYFIFTARHLCLKFQFTMHKVFSNSHRYRRVFQFDKAKDRYCDLVILLNFNNWFPRCANRLHLKPVSMDFQFVLHLYIQRSMILSKTKEINITTQKILLPYYRSSWL